MSLLRRPLEMIFARFLADAKAKAGGTSVVNQLASTWVGSAVTSLAAKLQRVKGGGGGGGDTANDTASSKPTPVSKAEAVTLPSSSATVPGRSAAAAISSSTTTSPSLPQPLVPVSDTPIANDAQRPISSISNHSAAASGGGWENDNWLSLDEPPPPPSLANRGRQMPAMAARAPARLKALTSTAAPGAGSLQAMGSIAKSSKAQPADWDSWDNPVDAPLSLLDSPLKPTAAAAARPMQAPTAAAVDTDEFFREMLDNSGAAAAAGRSRQGAAASRRPMKLAARRLD